LAHSKLIEKILQSVLIANNSISAKNANYITPELAVNKALKISEQSKIHWHQNL
ncbi:MAG: hypothetical protein MHPSP_004349, partial [Paramarteilia canceri]